MRNLPLGYNFWQEQLSLSLTITQMYQTENKMVENEKGFQPKFERHQIIL